MATQTIAKTGVTEEREESMSEFSARLRSERLSGTSGSSNVRQLQTTSGRDVSVGTETLSGGKEVALIVGSPEAIEEISPSKSRSRKRHFRTSTGKVVSVGIETFGGMDQRVMVGSPEAIQEISLKRPSIPSSFGVYDKITQQTRMSTPLETALVSQKLRESQVSYVPGKEPARQDVKLLLRDPNIEKIFFQSTDYGIDPVLFMSKQVQPKPMFGLAEPKKGVGVEGFFKFGGESFLDVSEFGSKVKQKGGEMYAWALDPQFQVQNPEQHLRTLKGGALLVGGGALAFAGGVVSGVTMPFRHPIETAKGFKELVLHPVSSGSQIVEDFVTNPFGTAGEFYGFGKAMKIVKKGSPIKLEYEKFGEGGIRTAGVTFGYEAFGRKAIPLVTYTPKIPIGEGFVQPKTLVGTKVFKLKIKDILTEPTEMLVEGKSISAKLQQEFAVKGIESLNELRNVESKFFTTEQLYKEGTKGLTPKETKALGKMIGKQKGKIFGSGAFVPQLEPSLRRVIGDIEAKFDVTSELKLSQYTTENLLALQKVSPKSVFRIVPEEPFHIEKKVKGQFEKVAEFKGEGIGEGDIAPAHAFGFDVWSSRDFMKVDKQLVAMLRGELKRKTAGSIMVKEQTSLGVAHEGRFKDVIDLFKITESLEKSKFGRTPKAKSFLATAEKLGVEFKTPGDIKFEILEKKLFDLKSPSLSSPGFSPGFSSPSVRSPKSPSKAFSPDFSPSVMSPAFSPSVASPKFSPDFSPSFSPDFSPSVRSPGSPRSPRSPGSPSVRSPKSPSLMSPSLVSPGFVSPKIPMFMIPKMDSSDLYGYKPKKSKDGLAYIPDFTAKVLGLRFKPQSKAQLKKLLKQQSTGLELARFGVDI